jgi:FkbM family methyltransferase
MNIDNFIWEPICYPGFKETVIKEIFDDRLYETFFLVEEGDVVFDIGASLGPFTYSILPRKPKHVFALEPSYEEFKTLVLNTRHGNVTHINKGISDFVGEMHFQYAFDKTHKMYATTFKTIIEQYGIQKIDFLKTDCEGGEYDVFNIDNLLWIKNNVRKIVGEWHLGEQWMKSKFKAFRDVYLRVFPNYRILSVDGVEITSQLWSDDFISHYTEVIIFIDNTVISTSH